MAKYEETSEHGTAIYVVVAAGTEEGGYDSVVEVTEKIVQNKE